MKHKKLYSDIDDLLEEIASMQILYSKRNADKLDQVIDDLLDSELFEDDLKLVAAAGMEIKIPDYIKNHKNL